jgi:long-chain fatty acid transport protein
MLQPKTISKIAIALAMAGALAGTAQASGFQLFEQNGAGVGDYHAGGAAEAVDASTAWYNPAGLTRIKSQQMVTGVVGVDTHIPYKGTVEVDPAGLPAGAKVAANAQGGNFAAVPFFYYALPINDRWAFGLSVNAPFGLKTDYGSNTYLRFAATKTGLTVLDVSPNFAFQVNKVVSVGFGLDFQYMQGTFDQYAQGGDVPQDDTRSKNTGDDTAFGYHAGILFQFTPQTRVGAAFHSQVIHRMTGTSKFVGPLANGGDGGVQKSNNLKATIVIPPFAVFSAFHRFNSKWAILGSATYTKWDAFKHIHLHNVESIDDGLDATLSNIMVVEDYKNTWNFALGAHYTPVEKWTIKAGLGYDQSPTRGRTRNVQLPGQDRIAVSTGVHYQVLQKLGLDVGYTHLFIRRANINNTQDLGAESVTTVGNSKSYANVYGLQLTWDF